MRNQVLTVCTALALASSPSEANDSVLVLARSIQQLADAYQNTRQVWNVQQSKDEKSLEGSREDLTGDNDNPLVANPDSIASRLILCQYSLEVNMDDSGTLAWVRHEEKLPDQMKTYQSTMLRSSGILQNRVCKVYFPIVKQGTIFLQDDSPLAFWVELPLNTLMMTPDFSSLGSALENSVEHESFRIKSSNSDTIVIELPLKNGGWYRCHANKRLFWRISKLEQLDRNFDLVSTTNITYDDNEAGGGFPTIKTIESKAFLKDRYTKVETTTTMTLVSLNFDDALIADHQVNLFPKGTVVNDKIINAVFVAQDSENSNPQ